MILLSKIWESNLKIKKQSVFIYDVMDGDTKVGEIFFNRSTSSKFGAHVDSRHRKVGEKEWTDNNYAYLSDVKKNLNFLFK